MRYRVIDCSDEVVATNWDILHLLRDFTNKISSEEGCIGDCQLVSSIFECLSESFLSVVADLFPKRRLQGFRFDTERLRLFLPFLEKPARGNRLTFVFPRAQIGSLFGFDIRVSCSPKFDCVSNLLVSR